MLTIYLLCFNESLLIPFVVKWWKERFSTCKIVIYDNYSTDNSKELAEGLGCEVRQFDSGNTLSDSVYLQVKNHCWKTATTDWVFVGDMDECMRINEDDLKLEESKGSTIVKAEGWNMINTDPNPSCKIILEDIKYGDRAYQYDKNYLFNKKYISEMNYEAGCHRANPVGNIKFSERAYQLFHYKALGADYLVNRYRLFASRMSEDNKKRGWAAHYLDSEETIRRNHSFFQKIERLTKLIE